MAARHNYHQHKTTGLWQRLSTICFLSHLPGRELWMVAEACGSLSMRSLLPGWGLQSTFLALGKQASRAEGGFGKLKGSVLDTCKI